MKKLSTDVVGSYAQILHSHGIEIYRTDEKIKTTFSGRPVYLLKMGDIEVKLFTHLRLGITVKNTFGLNVPELFTEKSHKK